MAAWNCIYKLRRAAQLLSPGTDFTWLIEIEKDLELLQEPKSKFDRIVSTEQLVEAGLTLIIEAKELTYAEFKRARGIRNGLMLVLLALCPIRLKNFATLEIGKTFKQVRGHWWITLPGGATKMKKPEDGPLQNGSIHSSTSISMRHVRFCLMGSRSIPTLCGFRRRPDSP